MRSSAPDLLSESVSAILRGFQRSQGSSAAAQKTDLSLADWCAANVKIVDRQQWTLEDNPPLEAIYRDQCQLDGSHRGMAVIKGAQTRLSVYQFLKQLWRMARFSLNIGYYLPDQRMAFAFSGQRFRKIAETIPALKQQRRGDDTENLQIQTFGDSTIYWQWMGGKATTDALPLDALVFDEVRKMAIEDVMETEERLSGNTRFQFVDFISTAGYPDGDIDFIVKKRSDRRLWHSDCRCPEGVVLSDHFRPEAIECIREDQHTGEVFYFCQRCNARVNPLRPKVMGEFAGWRPETPGAELRGYHFPQTISTTVSPASMLRSYRTASAMGGSAMERLFQNKIGKPFVSPDKIICTLDHLRACEDPTLSWERSGHNYFLGADQMGGSIYAVVKKLLPNMKSQLVHLAVFEGKDAFDGLYALMRAFDISVAVVDEMINYNEAHKLSMSFPGRVFLASYHENDKMIRWLDRDGDIAADERRSARAIVNPYRVHLDRTKILEWSLKRYVNRENVIPNPLALCAEMIWEGTRQWVLICEQVLYTHLTHIVREKEAVGDESGGKYRIVFRNIGLDPHFVHSNAYCDAAMARTERMANVVMAEVV
ncbi:MAG: phage terminase large subunit family protein [Candidatus Wallbacteria bacterium]|nr:phage terminase large subunit family protein [Candidatus Wallbacteria bacterium]